MAQISLVALTNTFDFWRIRTNEISARLNQFAINESQLYANSIVANNILKSLGNTVLGVAGKKTIVNGLLQANGRVIVTASFSSTGNNVLCAPNKTQIIHGNLLANGSVNVANNLSVSSNLVVRSLVANGSLGTAGYVLKTNGFKVYWDAVGGASVNLDPYLQVANAVATYTPKIDPTTSGLFAHTGRATVSTNLDVSGNTTSNKLTVTTSLVSSGNTKLAAAIVNGILSANGRLEVTKNLRSTGNTVLGAAGKKTVVEGIMSANGLMEVTKNLRSTGNNVFGAAGKKAVVNGLLQANGRIAVSTNIDVSGNTSTNKIFVTNHLKSSGNTFIGGAGKTSVVTGVLQANGRVTVSTNLAVTGNTSANKMTVTSSITGSAANAQFRSLGVGTTPGSNGEIRATNDITAYYSDERLKIKLGPIEDPMDKIRSLSGFYFEANELAQKMGYQKKREVGVSAQEVQAVLPEVVVPAPIDEKYLTVKYEKLVPLLIEAIKAMDARITELENR